MFADEEEEMMEAFAENQAEMQCAMKAAEWRHWLMITAAGAIRSSNVCRPLPRDLSH